MVDADRRAQILAMKPEDRAMLAEIIRKSRDQIPAEIAELEARQRELTAWLDEFDPTAEPAGRGRWMQTFTGRAFYLMTARVEDVDVLDIAHALARICRYGGHVATGFYSVAEHCVLMSYAVAPEDALWALLHDAGEGYVGDMVRPLKLAMPAYRHVEDHLMEVICERFGLDPQCPAEVKAADRRILLDERAAVLGPKPRPWADYLEELTPLGVRIESWSPEVAEKRYLDRFYELTGETRPGGDTPARCPACLSAAPAIRCHAGGYLCDDPSRFHEGSVNV